MMAAFSASPELASMAALRAALLRDSGSRETVERLCVIGGFRSFEAGRQLGADHIDDRLVFIARGAAKLTARASTVQTLARPDLPVEPQPHVLSFHFSGEFVSLQRQCDGHFRLVALNQLDCVVFAMEQFLDIAQGDPAVTRAVLVRALESQHRNRARMMQLGHKSAHQRVADFLVSMAGRLGASTNDACTLTLPMSRRDIASSLGLTLETVSRQFAELRAEGLVSTKGRSIVILSDLAALAHEAGLAGPMTTISRT